MCLLLRARESDRDIQQGENRRGAAPRVVLSDLRRFNDVYYIILKPRSKQFMYELKHTHNIQGNSYKLMVSVYCQYNRAALYLSVSFVKKNSVYMFLVWSKW